MVSVAVLSIMYFKAKSSGYSYVDWISIVVTDPLFNSFKPLEAM